MVASDYHGGNPMCRKPLKADEGLSYSPIGRSCSVKDIPGVHNEVRGDFEDPLDDLIE